MKFQDSDIKRFLLDSIPSRFQHVPPQEFENFIAHLLKTDGYSLEPVTRKGDHVCNLIAKKEDSSVMVRVLRLPPEQMVESDEIQKTTAARSFYETGQAWIITTSSFSKEATRLAHAEDIELWDWNELYTVLKDNFFEGKTHLEYALLTHPPLPHTEAKTDLKLKVKWQPEEGISDEWYNLDLVISNPGNRNIYLHLDLPAFIDQKHNQITAEKWADGEFVAGMLYEGASVRTNALFKASRIGERPKGGRVMLTCHERTDMPYTYHLSARLKGEACYIVTHCYTRQSMEYQVMTRFRDEIMRSSPAGRIFIFMYYAVSPLLVKAALKNKIADILLRSMTRSLVRLITGMYLKTIRK